MRDSEIEQRILLEIRSGNGRDSREICVFSSNGTVTIHGTVRTRQIKTAIQQAASRLEAVVAVINHLKVTIDVSPTRRITTQRAWRSSNAFLRPAIIEVAAKGATRA
jgi:BON domain-containing protein